MAQGNRRSTAGGGSSEGCFEEGSQTADTQNSLFGLSRRCIPSWVSRAKSRLAAVALRNTPAGVVPRIPFTRKRYAASVKRRSR